MFVSKLTAEQCAEARRLRAAGESLAAIGRHLGVTSAAVARRARRERWPSPKRPAPASRKTSRTRLPSAAAALVGALVCRFYNVIDIRIRMMEFRMLKQLQAQEKALASNQELPIADDEREGFGALIKNIQEVTELNAAIVLATDGGGRVTGAASADAQARASEAESFRREIAQRIEKLIPSS